MTDASSASEERQKVKDVSAMRRSEVVDGPSHRRETRAQIERAERGN
jgi:hypothetical protein